MAVTVADVKKLFNFGLGDEAVTPHLARAVRDFRDATYDETSAEIDELEAVGCKTLYYIAPLLWNEISDRVNELDGSLETYKDLKTFQAYWLGRSNSVPIINDTDINQTGETQWASI